MDLRHLGASVGALAALAVPIAGCGGSSSSASEKPNTTPKPSSSAQTGKASAITIDNFKFAPGTLAVSKGTHVTVTNRDSTTHTATANSGGFDTGNIAPGASATLTLSKPGTYAYDCTIHPFMHGTIVVS
jgi:plastocyanin